jgi:DNA-binding transcriptional LysR family regulator
MSGRKLGAALPFRISVEQILTLDWLPRVLIRFRELHPEVGLRAPR